MIPAEDKADYAQLRHELLLRFTFLTDSELKDEARRFQRECERLEAEAVLDAVDATEALAATIVTAADEAAADEAAGAGTVAVDKVAAAAIEAQATAVAVCAYSLPVAAVCEPVAAVCEPVAEDSEATAVIVATDARKADTKVTTTVITTAAFALVATDQVTTTIAAATRWVIAVAGEKAPSLTPTVELSPDVRKFRALACLRSFAVT